MLRDVQLSLYLSVGDVEKLFTTASPRESSDIYDSSARPDGINIYTLALRITIFAFRVLI